MEIQVNNLILDYLQHIRLQMAKDTVFIKQWILNNFFNYVNSTIKKQYYYITKNDIELYLTSISNCKLGTRHYRTTTIRDFYEYLTKNDPVCARIENPAAAIRFKKYKSHALPHVPGETAVKEWLVEHYGSPENNSESDVIALRDRLLLELAYGSGLRRAELAALNVEDLDLDCAQAIVRGKGGKERMVPLTQGSIDIVRRYLTLSQQSWNCLFENNTEFLEGESFPPGPSPKRLGHTPICGDTPQRPGKILNLLHFLKFSNAHCYPL